MIQLINDELDVYLSKVEAKNLYLNRSYSAVVDSVYNSMVSVSNSFNDVLNSIGSVSNSVESVSNSVNNITKSINSISGSVSTYRNATSSITSSLSSLSSSIEMLSKIANTYNYSLQIAKTLSSVAVLNHLTYIEGERYNHHIYWNLLRFSMDTSLYSEAVIETYHSQLSTLIYFWNGGPKKICLKLNTTSWPYHYPPWDANNLEELDIYLYTTVSKLSSYLNSFSGNGNLKRMGFVGSKVVFDSFGTEYNVHGLGIIGYPTNTTYTFSISTNKVSEVFVESLYSTETYNLHIYNDGDHVVTLNQFDNEGYYGTIKLNLSNQETLKSLLISGNNISFPSPVNYTFSNVSLWLFKIIHTVINHIFILTLEIQRKNF